MSKVKARSTFLYMHVSHCVYGLCRRGLEIKMKWLRKNFKLNFKSSFKGQSSRSPQVWAVQWLVKGWYRGYWLAGLRFTVFNVEDGFLSVSCTRTHHIQSTCAVIRSEVNVTCRILINCTTVAMGSHLQTMMATQWSANSRQRLRSPDVFALCGLDIWPNIKQGCTQENYRGPEKFPLPSLSPPHSQRTHTFSPSLHLPFLIPFPFPSSSLPLPSLSLPFSQIQLWGLGSAVSSPMGFEADWQSPSRNWFFNEKSGIW